jgi:hypothetical protein
MYVKMTVNHRTLRLAIGMALVLGMCSCTQDKRDRDEGFADHFSYKAEGIDLRMRIRGTDISVAGLVEIAFDIAHPSDVEVAIAESDDWRGELGLYELSSEPGRLIEGGRRIVRQEVYALEAQHAGDYVVARIRIDHWHRNQPLQRTHVDTEPFPVHVYSLMTNSIGENTDYADILDIEGPWVPEEGKSYWGVAVTGVALCVGALVWFYRRKTPKKVVEEETKSVPRPGDIALAKLTGLLGERLCERGLSDRFYVRLAHILRQYVESRYTRPVVSQTTEECLTAMAEDEVLDREKTELLRDFLTHCDAVKFAPIEIETEVGQTRCEQGRRFITTTMEERP